MGNGPGYDHAYAMAEELASERLQRNKKRLKVLEKLHQEIGLTEQSYRDDTIQFEIDHHLRVAKAFLELVTRDKK